MQYVCIYAPGSGAKFPLRRIKIPPRVNTQDGDDCGASCTARNKFLLYAGGAPHVAGHDSAAADGIPEGIPFRGEEREAILRALVFLPCFGDGKELEHRAKARAEGKLNVAAECTALRAVVALHAIDLLDHIAPAVAGGKGVVAQRGLFNGIMLAEIVVELLLMAPCYLRPRRNSGVCAKVK